MLLNDVLFGQFEITEPVLIELLQSASLQRLKGISMGGYYPAAPQVAGSFSRYEHSIGVFLLLRKFGATLEEQIAGLIHDVSHSAFSHTIDYINKGKDTQKTQEYQDSIHNDYVKSCDIAVILYKYHLNLEYILDDKNFTLKENELPDICADRIDYSLRQALHDNTLALEKIHGIIADLTVYNQQFIFKIPESALSFSKNFARCNQNIWSGIGSAVMFHLCGKMLGYALDCGILINEDLYTYSNQDIIAKLKECNNPIISEYLNKLEIAPEHYLAAESDSNYEITYCKVRYVNPYFLNQDKPMRTSEFYSAYAKQIASAPKFQEYKLKSTEE